MLVTALNPRIGYERAAKISLTAYQDDLTRRGAALKLGFLIGEQFDSWIRPDPMRPRAWLTFVIVGGGPTGVAPTGFNFNQELSGMRSAPEVKSEPASA